MNDISFDELYGDDSFGGGGGRRKRKRRSRKQSRTRNVKSPTSGSGLHVAPHVQWGNAMASGMTNDLTNPAAGSITGPSHGGGGGDIPSPTVPEYVPPLS